MINRPIESYIQEIERVLGDGETIYLDETCSRKLRTILEEIENKFKTESPVSQWIEKIETILKDNGIEFETSNNYINILNSSSMTRIKIFEYECKTIGKCVSIFVQEFDSLGNETYNKEFATLGKRFINRVKRNIG